MRSLRLLALVFLTLLLTSTHASSADERKGPFQTEQGEVYQDIEDFLKRGNLPPLVRAAGKGHIKRVRALIRKGVDVDIRDAFEQTALMWASYYGYLEIAQALVDAGADVNATHQRGSTALFSAADRNHLEIAKLLVRHGVDVTVINVDGKTALSIAEARGHAEMVSLIRQARRHQSKKNKSDFEL